MSIKYVKTRGKKLSRNREIFNKEIDRLKKGIKRYQNRGYLIDLEELIKKPERLSKKFLNELKAVKPKELAQLSNWVNIFTGEVKSGLERYREEREIIKKQGKLPNYEKIKYSESAAEVSILDTIRAGILEMQDSIKTQLIAKKWGELSLEPHKRILLSILEDNISAHEFDNTLSLYISYLKDNQETIFSYLNGIIYASKQEIIEAKINQVANILNYGALSKMLNEELSNALAEQEYFINYD